MNRKPTRVTPEMLAMIVDLLPSAGSLRDISAITGLSTQTVRTAAAPFLAIMKLQGTHPTCGCGKDRFHPYGCADGYRKADHSNFVPGRSRRVAEHLLERRTAIIAMLVAGDRFVDINAVMGFKNKDARQYMRFLTPEQRAERERAIEARGPIRSSRVQTASPEMLERRAVAIRKLVAGERVQDIAAHHSVHYHTIEKYMKYLTPAQRQQRVAAQRERAARDRAAPAPRPFSDTLYARIASAVPRWVTEATRDDIISEMYLAISEGTLREADIETNAQRFATNAVAMWESKFAPRSLDELRFEDGDERWIDNIPCPSALATLDRLNDMMIGVTR